MSQSDYSNISERSDSSVSSSRLSIRDLNRLAKYIQEGCQKRIVVMTGAGISTSAGIPDFRSPDTGLYTKLASLDLPHAEAIFDISYFRSKPEPFYTLAAGLQLEKSCPTISHLFIALLNKKNMLSMLFTQNIDCLELKADIPSEKITAAHGSFASQSCIDCKTRYPDDLMQHAVETGDIPHCGVPQCNGLVKPDIVFYGETLPLPFFSNRPLVRKADLIIVMGTSLTVYPFASLPGEAEAGVPRVLINREVAGDFGSRPDDYIILGDCDEGVRKLAEALGWKEELEKLWHEVNLKFKENKTAKLHDSLVLMTRDELLEADIQKLTEEIDKSLKVSKEHIDRTTEQLRKLSSDLSNHRTCHRG